MSTLPFDPNSIPEHLRQYFPDSAVNNLLSGGPAIDRISIRGRVWRLLEGGQEVAQSTAPELQVVLVAAAPHVSRSYYEGEYDPEKKEGPSCWSSDGNVPDAEVKQPRFSNCAQCPMNVAGSGNRGDSRACRFQQRIAVALPDRLNKVYAMTIPATSLWGDKVQPGQPAPLTQYAGFLAANRLPMEGVRTAMSFDINETQPTIRFRVAGWLTAEELHAAKALGQTDEAKQAVQANVIVREVQTLPAATRPVVAPMPTASMPVPQPMTQPQTISQQPTFGQAAATQPFGSTQGEFVNPSAQAGFTPTPVADGPKRTRRTKAEIAAAQSTPPAGFGSPQAFGHPQTAAPAGFNAPGGFTAPAGYTPPPEGIAEPTVISPQQAAAATGASADDIQALLNQWSKPQ